MLADLSVRGFLDELASNSPAPGGGSVSALAGAMAAGLLHMVLGLTLGREAFLSAEAELTPLAARAEELRIDLLRLVDEDTAAYNGVLAAFRLPRETDEQKRARAAGVQGAFKRAADVPMEVASRCVEVLRLCPALLEKGNPNALSDAGVAGRMAFAGFQGAAMNVRINLPSIEDEAYVAQARVRVSALLKEAAALQERIDAILALRLPG
jgi:methenyltetrahydrofolate cyclohydrolase